MKNENETLKVAFEGGSGVKSGSMAASACNLTDRIANTTVLIPAAGRVPDGLVALSNISCPAMVPVGGRPVIYWTMSYLRSLGLRKFVIAVSRRGMYVEDFVECTFGKECEVTFVVPSADGGVGRTVFELANWATTPSALVVLGDTHFHFADFAAVWTDEPAVLVNAVEESERWCIVQSDECGYVNTLHDKEPDREDPLSALIGVYYFPCVDELRMATQGAIRLTERAGRRTELSDILRLLNARARIRVLDTGDWLDCGNPDRQASSHRTLLQKRAFNELTVDGVFGTVTKRSQNVEKFLDEINYLRLLPSDLSVLFPRVVACSTDWSNPFLTMEYYGYPTLGEAFVFENVTPSLWEQVFLHLRQIIVGGFMAHKRPLSPSSVREMYLEKTRTRLHGMQAPEALTQIVADADWVVVNGRRLANLRSLWPRIEADVKSLSANTSGCVIHGDLCLSNILYDLRSRIVKLVDPRGSFGDTGIYGDPRYDVAKLYHSTHGLYDLIVNDLFHVSLEADQITLDIRCRPQHEEIRRRFEHVFFPDFDRREILLITGLLFASMPALHFDAPNRQIAMYARALQLFDELYGERSESSRGVRS